ncbi:MAG: transporter substrate-binding domain-containing protein [Bdellovibrionales bacterium]|jgi:polar amino acid transport system substrate-binding protein
MKKAVLGLALLGALGLLWVVLPTSHPAKTDQAEAQPSVLDRVEKTGNIRCGYWIYEPYISKDPNTGKMSGLTVDYLEQTAARVGKKIVWDIEVGFDQILPAINYNRIDMFCVPCSPNDDFRKQFDFAGSFGKLPYYLYVAKNSTITKAQMQTARFAVMDGYLTSPKTLEYFPKSTITSLPQTSSLADLYNHLKYGKVDVLLNEHLSALNYMRNNPDVVRRYEDTPVFTATMSFPNKKGDTRWGAFVQQMTDTTTPENRALFINFLKKYNVSEDALIP